MEAESPVVCRRKKRTTTVAVQPVVSEPKLTLFEHAAANPPPNAVPPLAPLPYRHPADGRAGT